MLKLIQDDDDDDDDDPHYLPVTFGSKVRNPYHLWSLRFKIVQLISSQKIPNFLSWRIWSIVGAPIPSA